MFAEFLRVCLRLKRENPDVARVMLRLSTEYPGDLGILMPLVLNFLKLKTGQAFFMTVDEPHAYLRGDILEVPILCFRKKKKITPFR